MGDACVERDGAKGETRREFLILAGSVAAVACLPRVEPATAEEADQGARCKVDRYAGVRHLPIGQVDGADSHLAVDVPRGCYMLPRLPRPASMQHAGDLPLTWAWRLGCTPNWHGDSGVLFVSLIPEAGGDLHARVQDHVPALVEAANLRWTPKDVVRVEETRLKVRGLPKAARSREVIHFESEGKGGLQVRYATLLIPGDEATALVWVGERLGGTLVKAILRGLEVVPSSKRPENSPPLMLTCPVGDWILRCGFEPAKGFVSSFNADLDAAARWTDGNQVSWTLRIDSMEDVTLPPDFFEHHREALTKAIPDAEIEEVVIAIGREKIPLLTLVQQTLSGPVRTAVLGAQDGRARVSWIVQDTPGTGEDVARWGKRVVKDMQKRFRSWYVESYEFQERQRDR